MAALKWIWPEKMPDWREHDPECVKRARGMDWQKPAKIEKGVEIVIKTIDPIKGRAEMCDANKSNIVHTTTLRTCSCEAYKYREKLGRGPCKHMVRLAMELGLVNENGCTPEEQLAEDIRNVEARLALTAGFYHVIHQPLIADEEYDRLKTSYLELLNLAGETIAEAVPAQAIVKESNSVSAIENQTDSSKSSFGIAEAIYYLKSRNLEYIDKTSVGGALWFFDLDAAREFKANGLRISYSDTGSRSNGKRPGWYIPSKKQ